MISRNFGTDTYQDQLVGIAYILPRLFFSYEVKMPEQMMYRKRLLQAVEAFLQETPSSIVQGQEIINSVTPRYGQSHNVSL